MKPGQVPLLTVLTLAAALGAGRHAATAATTGPAGTAFYAPPSPLPAGTHGDVIWSRPLQGAAALPAAAENTLVLYHTTSVTGADVAVSGAIAIPKGDPPARGWPIVSWAHGTTGNAPQCAPTRDGTANLEQRYLDAWVARGYAVLQTDYEGQGVPGLHPYLVGAAAARDVTDIVRAARQLYPKLGTRWFALGHSEGGSASIFTGAVGPAWAPELQLLGAVSFAPVSHIASLLYSVPNMKEPGGDVVLTLEMIEGIASSDPAIHLSDLMTRQAFAKLPEIQRRCTEALMNDNAWNDLAPADIFRPDADMQPLLVDFARNESNRVHLDVPLLLMQGDSDDVIKPRLTDLVDAELCRNGTRVTYDRLKGKDHDSIVTGSLPQVEAWVDAVAAGTPPPSTCP